MNILLYETGSGFGGSAVSLHRLVKYLNRERYSPCVVVHGLGPKLLEIRKIGIDLRTVSFVLPFPQNASGKVIRNIHFYGNLLVNASVNACRIASIIRKNGISLVHLNNGIYEGLAGLLAAKFTGVPCIAHIRGTETLTKLERSLGRWLKNIVTLNSYVENEYIKTFGPEKVSLIFNGVDLEAYENVPRGALRSEYGLDKECILIGTIARLVPGKGISEFLTAASRVLKIMNRVKFLVVGDDPFGGAYAEDQKRLCRDLGIERYVIFTGWRNDMPKVLSDLDVVAQVSTSPEGMSLTPIEAMALSKPVIATDVPGYTDTVLDGITGYIVPKGDTSLLADKILSLAKDPGQAISFGALGRKRVQEHFDVKITAKKIEYLYDHCAKHKASV